MVRFLWALFLVLLIMWLIGFAVDWGVFVWLLLVGAVVVLLFNMLFGAWGRRRY